MDDKTLVERVAHKFHPNVVKRGPTDCWDWTGSKLAKDGRGVISDRGKNITAPRVALMLAGSFPPSDNAFACHTCDNPNCVNPDHLWWGTNQENIKDAAAKKRLPMQQKTHCIKGHEFTEENTFIQRRASGWVTRLCRQCMKEQGARMREKRRRESEELREAKVLIEAQATRIEALEAALNKPEIHDWAKGVAFEAAHQRERWGVEHDAGKTPFDWFWLIGYLAQKAADAAVRGDTEKAMHHTISTGAALANWHLALSGVDNSMRPGIEPLKALEGSGNG